MTYKFEFPTIFCITINFINLIHFKIILYANQ